MNTLKSQLKISKLVFVILFCLSLIALPFIILNDEGVFENHYYVVIFPILSLLVFYLYLRESPGIIFDSQFITIKYPFKTKSFDWSSVKGVFLNKKEKHGTQKSEATIIIFNNGEKLNIWQDGYSNSKEMKNYIFKISSEKVLDVVTRAHTNSLHPMTVKRYSGSLYTSFNNLFFVAIAIFLSIALKSKPKSEFILLIPIGFLLLTYVGMGSGMYYFIIDEGFLYVKNFYFPWTIKKIRLEDILGADIEPMYKKPVGLRIITNDFDSKFYQAATLRQKNWDDLRGDLRYIGIPARDDR